MSELIGALGLPGAIAALTASALAGVKLKQALNGGGPALKLGAQMLVKLTSIETALLASGTMWADYMREGREAMKDIVIIKDRV